MTTKPASSISVMVLWAPMLSLLSAFSYAGEIIPPASVPVVSVRMHTFHRSIPWFGQVESRRAVQIAARVSGRIKAVKVKDEAPVHSGDALFVLGGRMVDSRLHDLQTQLDQARKAVELAGRNLKLKLAQRRASLATREQVNISKMALAGARTRASSVRQALISYSAAIRIMAPIDGVLTSRRVRQGQYVTAGMPLARIVNPDDVRILATLYEADRISLQGMDATVVEGRHRPIISRVSRIMPERTVTGASRIWIEGTALREFAPGMPVHGMVLLPTYHALAVPAVAIARNEKGEAFVFVKTARGFRTQRVLTGLRDHAWVEILSGLKDGELVLASGAYERLYRSFSKIYRAPD